ncbi:HAD-superfamily hydrolase, subfamily IA, variant 3 [[Leptolyngbya] sp. PCC 7376]|uniref:HAD family hydrolase n=1 Tax=[Leptolyngbya] sp. PCC 7376 TaxID=111781 RepID=UPI00029EDF94|nr:HAD family hydrolase [[Leptolyngbya] sp. PCC 7376]AFY39474.1 HAD-superfamily hydrolase, subfamily IA, variant 3 [[Leptolyngbya] sp. PCC 7376]
MAKLEALIFDVDGTLANTEKDAHRVAFNRAFADADLGWEWSVELYGKLLKVAGGKERIRFYINDWKPKMPEIEDLTEFIKGLHASKTKHYCDLLANEVLPLRPGVRRLIDEAREKGIRLAIATTTTPANVTALVTHSLAPDAMDWFEVIAAGDMVPQKKPAPDIFLYALEKMNLSADQCVAFEDSGNGWLSARDSGLTTVVTVNNYTENQDFSGADLILSNLGEPDQPFNIVSGDVGEKSYFDVDLAADLLSRKSNT